MELASLLLTGMFVLLIGAIIAGVPAWLAIGGVPLLIALLSSVLGVFDIVLLSAFPQRVFGMMGNQLFIAIPLFIFMGVLLEKSGLAQLMLQAVGRLGRGSPVKLALGVLAISTLIAASTGIAGATIVMLGLIAYPALTRNRVPGSLASGLAVSAGTLGQIIPPSIVLIVLADQVSNAWQAAQRSNGVFSVEPVTVSEVFAAALLPGLLLVGLYAVYACISLLRAKPGQDAVGEEAASHALSRDLLWLCLPLFLIVAVLGSIVAGFATATEAAAIGAIGALMLVGLKQAMASRCGLWLVVTGIASFILLFVIGSLGGAPDWLAVVLLMIFAMGVIAACLLAIKAGYLVASLRETVLLSGVIFAIVMVASLLSLVFRGLGGEEIFADLVASLPGEASTAVITVLVLVFILGFVLEFIEIIFIVVPIAGPVLFSLGVEPLWFAILLAINLQTSFLTPPMGVALFYFKSVVSKGFPTAMLYRGIIPFILLQLTVLTTVFFWPDLALALPKWLFG